MAEAYGTFEYGTGDLEGLARYMLQRARSVKKGKKREVFTNYAAVAQNAADRICKLERRVEKL